MSIQFRPDLTLDTAEFVLCVSSKTVNYQITHEPIVVYEAGTVVLSSSLFEVEPTLLVVDGLERFFETSRSWAIPVGSLKL